MTTAPEIVTTLSRQYMRLAPPTLRHKGRTYRLRHDHTLADFDGQAVSFQYLASKRPGAVLNDKLVVKISYDGVADAYSVTIKHWDAETFESTTLHESSRPVYTEALSRVAEWLPA